MGTNLDQLKAIYAALGGTPADVADMTNNAAVLAQIAVQAAVVAAAATAELPAVAKADEGKVLTVDNKGKWVAALPASQLPAVTATDNGSVLKVIDGAWGVGEDATE